MPFVDVLLIYQVVQSEMQRLQVFQTPTSHPPAKVLMPRGASPVGRRTTLSPDLATTSGGFDRRSSHLMLAEENRDARLAPAERMVVTSSSVRSRRRDERKDDIEAAGYPAHALPRKTVHPGKSLLT